MTRADADPITACGAAGADRRVRAGLADARTLTGAGWLSPDQVKLVADAVLARCDGLDGLADDVVGDHESCKRVFGPGALRCRAGASASCLSDAQVEAVRT